MTCPECHSENPEVAAFCFRCGHQLRGGDRSAHGRGGSYALQPAESVTSFALVSTIMPATNKKAAQSYRWALLVTGALVLLFTLTGLIPAAIVAGAFLVPVTYLVYLYDVNVWEEAPASVIMVLFLLTGLLSILVSLTFFVWAFKPQFGALLIGSSGRGGIANLPVTSLLLFAVLLPLIAEVAKEIGPILLARRAAFDDMIDGFTFGVAAGTAYAAFETVIAFGPIFRAPSLHTSVGIGSWLMVILNIAIVKSVIYGSATGIAVAAFSGRGEGYDGFKPRYYQNFLFAVAANAVYWLGVRLLAYAPFGQGLGLLWGFLVAALLIVRVRLMLQAALLEAAVEDAAKGVRAKAATTGGGFCPECEMALLADSMFCIVCGSSVRATSSGGRKHIRTSAGMGGGA